jgi:dihydrodipicolinate synthase/N-acetylneuraminate lyase
MKTLFGVVTPMVTPFLTNEDVDIETLKIFTSWLIKSGVNGLFPCGTTGEGHLLTNEEKKLIAETVIKETNSRIPVFIQTGAMSLRDTILLSKHALNYGADGVGVVTPSYYTLPQQAIIDYYIALSKELPSDFPIYMYSIPDNAINDIEVKTAQLIAEKCPNIVGIKYSGNDFVQLEAYTDIRKGNFSVLAGNDRTLASVMAAGCDGTVSGLSNIFNKKVIAVYKAFMNKDIEKAIKLQKDIYRNSLCLFDGFFLASLKAGLGFCDMPVGKLRKPLPELTGDQYIKLEESFKKIDF